MTDHDAEIVKAAEAVIAQWRQHCPVALSWEPADDLVKAVDAKREANEPQATYIRAYGKAYGTTVQYWSGNHIRGLEAVAVLAADRASSLVLGAFNAAINSLPVETLPSGAAGISKAAVKQAIIDALRPKATA